MKVKATTIVQVNIEEGEHKGGYLINHEGILFKMEREGPKLIFCPHRG